jgi:DNA-binding CsgD family transcriptional regulator
MKLTILKEKYNTLTDSLHCEVSEEDYIRLAPKIESLRNMSEIENRAISLYDINTKKFLLKVDKHIELLGYSSKDKIDISNIDNYHDMIHSEDLAFLFDSEIKMYQYLNPIKSNNKKDYKLIYGYRVRSKSGDYIRFLHQLMIYEVDRQYNSWIMLVISDVLSSFAADEKPRRMVINVKTKRVHLFNDEIGIKSYLITARELEILNLLSQGLDSIEIASKLNISLSTVNNHRQHILQRTATKNTVQATTYLKCIGLI